MSAPGSEVIQRGMSGRIPRQVVCPSEVRRRMPRSTRSLVELVDRTARGEVEAFAEFYEATSRRVFGLALKILEDRSAAEDASLEAFTYLWRNADRYDPERGNVMQWVLTVARSRALDQLRSSVRRGSRELPFDAVSEMQDPEPGPEALSSRAQQCVRVRQALASLPREQRRAIETAYWAGLSHAQLADALGQPLGTVKSRIRMGLDSLRRQLAEEL